jgi:hypothetical protein
MTVIVLVVETVPDAQVTSEGRAVSADVLLPS